MQKESLNIKSENKETESEQKSEIRSPKTELHANPKTEKESKSGKQEKSSSDLMAGLMPGNINYII